MKTRFDFYSPVTGRVHLSSMLDNPSEGLTRAQGWEVVKILRKAKKELEKVIGEDSVRLSLDSWEATVLWYMVLFRPIYFDDRDPVFGGHTWSVYEIIRRPDLAQKLVKTDLGVVYDPDHMWLILVWPEAMKGVLEGCYKCHSWQKIEREYKKKTGDDPDLSVWKRLAESYSYVVPKWELQKMAYLREYLFHREVGYDDITVVDLLGMDVPRLDVDNTKNLEFESARRVRFVHFYTDDRREYNAVREEIRRKAKEVDKTAPEYRWTERIRRPTRKRPGKSDLEELNPYRDASRIVFQLPTKLGLKRGRTGRAPLMLTEAQSNLLFESCIDAFYNGDLVKPDWPRVDAMLEELAELVKDEFVPDAFNRWQEFRKEAKAIRKGSDEDGYWEGD